MVGFTEPDQTITFLNSTVLSFNVSLGLGSTAESNISIDLVDDCNLGQEFLPFNGTTTVGDPVYFPDSAPSNFPFVFGGVLQSWTYNQGSNGRTYQCTITDPRQLLENAVVIIDSYLDLPTQAYNYFNVYNQAEGQVLLGNCSVFGITGTSERGMPYLSILQQLLAMDPVIFSPTSNLTGNYYRVNFADFPISQVPPYYRVPGPSITILQLLQDVCDALGSQFYCWLDPGNIIRIGLVPYRNWPNDTISKTLSGYKDKGVATDLSYGQELRNDKTRTVMFGEQQHYLSGSSTFGFYFGEDINPITALPYPVVPFAYSRNDGFWIAKRIEDINPTLYRPLPGMGPWTISEMDIRCAMASFDLWQNRVFSSDIPGTFNAAIRSNYVQYTGGDMMGAAFGQLAGDVPPERRAKAYIDLANNPGPTKQEYDNIMELDMQALHGWVKSLGDTYYGKQFFTQLNQTICQKVGENFQEIIFTDVPTSQGGWVDPFVPVLGLYPPDLDHFKLEDGRVTAFVGFYDNTVPQDEYPDPSGAPPPDENTPTNPNIDPQ